MHKLLIAITFVSLLLLGQAKASDGFEFADYDYGTFDQYEPEQYTDEME